MIDDGHGFYRPNGWHDCGAKYDNLEEWELNRRLSYLLRQNLYSHCYDITLASTDKTFPHRLQPVSKDEDLNRRCIVANAWRADLFVSLHFNRSFNHAAHGGLVLLHNDNNAWIGQTFLERLPRSRWSRIHYKPRTRVLLKTKMPAILVETMFLSSVLDRTYIVTEGLEFVAWNLSIAVRQVADRMARDR